MNVRTSIWAICFLLLWVVLEACNNDYHTQNTKTLRIQIASQPDILNPALSSLSVSSYIENVMALPMAIRDDSNQWWVPVLATSFNPRMTSDSISYPITIRPEARWSDGQPVTLEDMLYTIKMGMNPYITKQSWAAYLDLITSVHVNKDTLILSMATPYILADEFIAGLSPYPAHVLDVEKWLDSIPFDHIKNRVFTDSDRDKLQVLAQKFNEYGSPDHWPEPVTGLFKVSNWAPEQSITLSRQNDFWGEGVQELKQVFDTNIDTLTYVIIPDPQNALHAYTSGVIDVLNTVDGRDSALVSSFQGEVYEIPTLQMYYISVNHRNPILGQKNIRQALNMSINREDMIHRLFQDNAQPAYGPIHPSKSYFGSPDVTFDPDESRKIFMDLGCKDSDDDGILECPVNGKNQELSLHIWTTRSQVSRNVATLLKGYWKSVGVDLEIQSADFRTFLPHLQNKTYDLATLALRQNSLLDDPYPLWHSTQADATGKNYQALINDSIDHTLEQLRESVQPTQQKKYYLRLQELFSEEVPVFFLVAPDDLLGVRKEVELKWSSRRPGYDLLRSKINR